MSTTFSIKGQVTIPRQIRYALGLRPGKPVEFAVNQDGDLVIDKAKSSVTSKLEIKAI